MRPPIRALVAATVALATTLSALTLSAPPAAAFSAPKLKYSADSASVISALKSQIGTVTLSTILTSGLNRTMTSGSACSPAALAGISGLKTKLCFDPADQAVTYWRPQGVAGTPERMPDASQDWASTGKHPLIVSWYDHDDGTGAGQDTVEKGVRISVIDPATQTYRHVLLAVPYTNSSGNASYKAVSGDHASGIAWIGDYLYVTDATVGLRVFSLLNILDLSGSKADGGLPIDRDSGDKVGRQSSVWYTFGYSYVVPEVGVWKIQGTATQDTSGYVCGTSGTAPTIDFADTDRTDNADKPLLVTGEFCRSGRKPTVTVWDFLGMHNWVKSGTGSSTVTATKILTSSQFDAQGGTMVSDALEIISGWKCGTNYLTSYPASGTPRTVQLPYGSEDVMYDRSTRQLYTVTELPTGYSDKVTCGGRAVFSVAAL